MQRRTFLRRAAGWMLASSSLGALAEACTPRSPATSGSVPPSTVPSPPSASPHTSWATFSGQLQGTLIRPGDHAYPNARLDFDPRFDTIRPQGIVMAASAQDVARSIAFARDRGLPFAARCGGHSYGGYSLARGLVIDVSELDGVRAASGTATVGAGARLIDVAAGLAPAGVVVPGGTCATVGIAGLTMGGGQGVIGRMFGLTCDALQAATVVTADGQVIRCDENEHADLFWALRGGGGGNFGVATSFTFATHPLASLTLFTLTWPWSAAPSVLRAWQTWGPGAPQPLWSSCRLRWEPGPGPAVSVGGAWAGSPSGLDTHLDDLSSAVGSAPGRSVTTMAYLDAAKYLAGCAGLPLQACRLTTAMPAGKLPREASLAKSDFFDRPMSDPVAEALLAAIEGRRSSTSLSSQEGGVLLDAWGGTIAATASDATAFPHRSARFLAQEFVTLQTGASGEVVDANQAWLQRLWQSLRPSASGYAYVNYIDPDLDGWANAYYGANLSRLVQVKRAYDPEDAFHFAQSVPLSLDGGSTASS